MPSAVARTRGAFTREVTRMRIQQQRVAARVLLAQHSRGRAHAHHAISRS
jgi:hypothetical protein